MSRLWDLITMVFKWQITLSSDIIGVTLRHLYEIETYLINPETHLQLHRVQNVIENFNKILGKTEKEKIREDILTWMQGYNIKVALLLRMGLQNEDGTFIFDNHNPVAEEMLKNLGENIYEVTQNGKILEQENKEKANEKENYELQTFADEMLGKRKMSSENCPNMRLLINDNKQKDEIKLEIFDNIDVSTQDSTLRKIFSDLNLQDVDMDYASSSSSEWEEEVEAVASFLAVEDRKYSNRVWVHNINKKKEKVGEFYRLVSELRKDPKRFHMYFRMTIEEFDYLHQLIENDIKKMNTQFRRAITSEERLAVCLICEKMYAILIILTILVLLYYKFVKSLTYWKQNGVPQHHPLKIAKDFLVTLIRQPGLAQMFESFCKSFPDSRYFGIYQFFGKSLVIQDADLIKKITVKDFDHFVDHVQFSPGDEPLWERNIFSLKGKNKWKSLRATLSPSFTSSKMKLMFNLMLESTQKFTSYFEHQLGNKPCIIIEMKDVFTRYANDVIASIAFGYSCDSLRVPENTFYVTAKQIIPQENIFEHIKTYIMFSVPAVAKCFGIKFLQKTSADFFSDIINQTLKIRKEQNIVRHDMVHLLMEEMKNREQNDEKDKLTEIDITAQALLFFFAGFESVSTLMCFTAYELAVNVDIQKRLQKEIDDTLEECEGTVTYDALFKMQYMDMVMSESSRKWPAGIVTDRVCTKAYEIPPEKPGEVSVYLNKDDIVWIPIFGIHRDPKLFSNPERFDPERFNDENKSTNRFALMETKLLFFQILSKFDIMVVQKTQVPLQLAKSSFQYFGIYQFFTKKLVVQDADLIKKITVKDFDHFVDHTQFTSGDEPLWERSIFFLFLGDKWKSLRATLSPFFTSSKMKLMFNLMLESTEKFTSYFEQELVSKSCVSRDMKEVFTRYANDVIASIAFGYSCDSLSDPENTFYVNAKQIVPKENIFENIKLYIFFNIPEVAKYLGIKFLPKTATDFFVNIISQNINNRKEQNIVRHDMVHLLLEEMKNREHTDAKDKLTEMDITAQALQFFLAGFETVSTFMCFTAYELAVNVDIQKRLQKEIDETLEECGGTVTYDALLKMQYLDMVISESLRKWPASIVTDRLCTKAYEIPPEKPGEVSVYLDKGDMLWIPIFGIHRNPKLFPNPERFDPERFNDENKLNINSYTFIPFGSGPRTCIANRFALMETKLLFFQILTKFDIVVVEKTQIPLQLAKSPIQLNAEKGFWLGFKLRNKE
ncbi:hypothetical protein RN001_013285 [Aquatica leii]|uniref:Cytochrome P450 n=1 Tax=Aquatica leii TaxID=1421715 RepID=A0AAN7NW87_9COLE|nr:hypothetical protein RN001_013285 [Aquatica leii]